MTQKEYNIDIYNIECLNISILYVLWDMTQKDLSRLSTTTHTATHCNTHCNTLYSIRTMGHESERPFSNTLQHTATHCNTLQHTATHCNTLQHTIYIYITRTMGHDSKRPLSSLKRVCHKSNMTQKDTSRHIISIWSGYD